MQLKAPQILEITTTVTLSFFPACRGNSGIDLQASLCVSTYGDTSSGSTRSSVHLVLNEVGFGVVVSCGHNVHNVP